MHVYVDCRLQPRYTLPRDWHKEASAAQRLAPDQTCFPLTRSWGRCSLGAPPAAEVIPQERMGSVQLQLAAAL